jgi:hypothetical protein
MSWLDALGWIGTVIVVLSLMQARVLRFRIMNFIGGVVLIVFNTLIGVWPMVAMNTVICAINAWFIARLWSSRHDEHVYIVLEVGPTDAYLQHLLRTHRADIAAFFPHFDPADDSPRRTAFLVQKGDETVGLVMARDAGDGIAQIDLDYVTERFRDFSPGEFVFRRSGLFRDLGFRRVLSPPGMVSPYYASVGFHRVGDGYALDLV